MDRKWSKRNDKLILRAQNPLHRQKRLLGESDSSDDDDEDDQHMTAALNEAEECVVRGRVMNLANFKKVYFFIRPIKEGSQVGYFFFQIDIPMLYYLST